MDCNLYHIFIVGTIMFLIGLSVSSLIVKKRFRSIHTLLEALKNQDYSFRLPQKNNEINKTLNQITELLQSDKLSITQQEKYYELIINSMSIGVIVTDDDFNIVKCNDETLRLFNRSSLTHVSQLSAWDNFDNTLTELSPKEKRHVLIKTSQKELNISVHLDLITLRGKALRIFTINDIHTEIDRNEFDSWIKLTRVLTHEIMNGIAPISSLSNIMKQENNIPDNIREGLEAISSSSQSLINFVDSYRRFTRIPTPIPALVNVSTMLRQIKELNGNVKINTYIEPDDLMIYADESLILQVITNIVKNAIEATSEINNREIRIKAYTTENDTVKIDISNNGPAIPKDELNEIFVPFFTTKKDGNGIGLSVSRQIMILSGGNLTVSSTPNSKFTTTFTLHFP